MQVCGCGATALHCVLTRAGLTSLPTSTQTQCVRADVQKRSLLNFQK